MGQYFGLLFSGIWKGSFWVARWGTFRALLGNSSGFYAGVGKKEWDEDAYLFGLSIGLAQMLIFVTLFSGFLGLWLGAGGLVVFLVGLCIGLTGWFLGALILYYGIAWCFAAALKLITQKDEKAKIRPILFTLWPAGLLGVVPGIGGLLTLAAFLVLMVIAYEKALRVARGPAVGASILGFVFTAVAAWIPGLAAGWGMLALVGGISAHLHMASAGMAGSLEKPKSQVISLPDRWPLLESLHHRSENQKLADAVEVIHQEILQSLSGDIDAQEDATPALIQLYGDPDQAPMDAYRLAVKETLEKDQAIKEKNRSSYWAPDFDQTLDSYYDKGKGPATVSVDAIESRRRAVQLQAQAAGSRDAVWNMLGALARAREAQPSAGSKTALHPAPEARGGQTAPQAVSTAAAQVPVAPEATPTPASDPLLKAAKQAGTDAAVDGARKLLGF